MRNMLLLREDPLESQRWSWLHLDGSAVARGVIHSGSLAEAAAEANGLRVMVLMPATDCLLTRVRVPGRNRKKLLQAVPYALEEQLSDDVDRLHFALGTELGNGEWQVAITNKQRMHSFMALLGDAGLDVQYVLPEQLAVPLLEGGSSVLMDHDTAVIRSGAYSGFAIDRDNLGMVLTGWNQEDPDVQAGLQIFVEQDIAPPDLADYHGDIRIEHYPRDPLAVFSQGLDMKAINLLQGEFSRSGEWSRVWHQWRATALLLLAGVLISNAVMAVDYYRLNKESARLNMQIEETFRKAFPETRRVVNPRAQMQQKLDELQHGQGMDNRFLTLLGQSGRVIKDIKDVEITGANYRSGRLDLDLNVGSLQLLDQLKQVLTRSGALSVEIQSATTGDDQRVKSRLRIAGVKS